MDAVALDALIPPQSSLCEAVHTLESTLLNSPVKVADVLYAGVLFHACAPHFSPSSQFFHLYASVQHTVNSQTFQQ